MTSEALVSNFRTAFPELHVYEDPAMIRFGTTPENSSLKEILGWLKLHKVTKVCFDDYFSDDFELLFSFEEVWVSALRWDDSFVRWVREQNREGRTYETKVIKINNLRWLFLENELRILLEIFPRLEKLQFMGAEFGAPDDPKIEALGYDASPNMSTKDVIDILEDLADPFSF
jgi:hypothetical protein